MRLYRWVGGDVKERYAEYVAQVGLVTGASGWAYGTAHCTQPFETLTKHPSSSANDN